jgi:hypothetical protein
MQAERRHGAELAALHDVGRDLSAEPVAVDVGFGVVAPAVDVGVLASGVKAVAAEPFSAVRLGDLIGIKSHRDRNVAR